MDTPLPLPASGPERGIFLAALRSYSASCRPPQLHESCPFSTYISQGARGCGEECVAILGSHDVGPESAGIPLTGNGLAAAARPDLTSSPSERGVERAFDAAEIYYRESDHGDVAAYSAVTTIYALSQIVARPPSDRLNAGGFDALIERLAVHGFDVDAVVRHGLRASLTNAIAFTTIFSSLVDAAAAENSDAEKDEPGVSPDGPQLQSNGLSPEWPALRDTLYSGYAATGHGNVSVETEGKLVLSTRPSRT